MRGDGSVEGYLEDHVGGLLFREYGVRKFSSYRRKGRDRRLRAKSTCGNGSSPNVVYLFSRLKLVLE